MIPTKLHRYVVVEGADENAKNSNGETLRRVVTFKGHKNVATLLKRHGGKESN